MVKNKVIRLRVTEEQSVLFKNAAAKASIPLSVWILRRLSECASVADSVELLNDVATAKTNVATKSKQKGSTKKPWCGLKDYK